MQLIPRGPNVPDALLSAHEDGNVVFFCGAGVSRGAKLPLFEELTERVFRNTGHEHDWKEFRKKAPRKQKSLDELLEWLQGELHNGRHGVVSEIWNELSQIHDTELSTKLHKSLITLSKTKSSPYQTKLVTTNFDRIFENCLHGRTKRPEALIAPRPPIPKNHYWDGIVYLHGLLPEEPYNPNNIDNLIITSGDFGRAYLSERWASRFVTEMFRNYVICFIGYSLNDPVMRYLTDAMANDKRDGYPTPTRFIFTDLESDWKARGITPILYTRTTNHHLLRETISAWADNYSKANDAKKQIVADIASSSPPSTVGDITYREQETTGRLMWALRSEKAAQFFAEMNPRPSWEWIEILISKEFNFNDLESFGHKFLPKYPPKDFSSFSLLEPKLKFENSENWYLSEYVNRYYIPDNIVRYFYIWITRHLEKPEVAIFLMNRFFPLKPALNHLIRYRLDEQYKHAKNTDSRLTFPDDPIISPVMRNIWELFLAGATEKFNSRSDRLSFYEWKEKCELYGFTLTNKNELIELLKPRIELSYLSYSGIATLLPGHERPELDEAEFISDFFYPEVDLAIEDGANELKRIALDPDTSKEDKRYLLKLYLTTIGEILHFGDQFYPENRFSRVLTGSEIDDFDTEEEHYIRQWYFLGSAVLRLLSEFQESSPETLTETVAECLDSPCILMKRIALRCIQTCEFFNGDYIFEVIMSNADKLLINRHLRIELQRLLEGRAGDFSTTQSNQVGELIYKFDYEGQAVDE